MKIISLQAENFKKLHAIEITPDGNFVQITGRNGQGKTSTLDAIWVALAGISAAPKAPIRKGAESARIRLDLGEIRVVRNFKQAEGGSYTTSLSVESADGARYPSPQKMLDTLLGALSFDPLAFSRMDAKKQFDTLRTFVPDIDFDAIDRAHTGDYQKRTDINRRAKEMQASADQIHVSDQAPTQPIDETALVAKLKEAGDFNSDIERRRANREALAAQLVNDDKAISDLQDKIDSLQDEVKTRARTTQEKRDKLTKAPPLPDAIDTAAVATELNTAREINQKHAKWAADKQRRTEFVCSAAGLVTASEEITKCMAQRQKDKQAAIAAAKLPIEGISFGDGTVLLNDLPFDQASDAEKLRTSVAISMAANPKLPVVLIRDGSLLDEEGLRLVASMADARNCQVWIERVSSDGKVGIVLENGYIKDQQEEE